VDIGAWLRGLGLGQYEQAFRDNAVDAEVLPELSDADLEGSARSSATVRGCSRPSPPCPAGRPRWPCQR
jgi:hypothetical protein